MNLKFFDEETYQSIKNTTYRHRKERRHYQGYFPSIEELEELAVKQNGLCYWSGEILVFSGNYRKRTVSLDRIIPRGEYITQNIRLVHKMVNQMQKCYSDDAFLKMVIKIAKYNKNIRTNK
jgi:hypothetical protein